MSLLESAQGMVKSRKRWLEEEEKVLQLVMDLPADIQSLEGSASFNYKDELELDFRDEKAIEVLKSYKAKISTPEVVSYSGNYSAKGKMFLGTLPVHLAIYDLSAPEGCRVEKYYERVTRYRSVCEDGGKNSTSE